MGSDVSPPSRLRGAAIGATLAAIVCAAPLASHGQSAPERATARKLADEADRRVAAGDARGAIELFRKADAIFPAPTLKLALGRQLAAVGELLEARQVLLSAASSEPSRGEPAPWAPARKAAAREAEELVARVPTLEIMVTFEPPGSAPAAGVRVQVDGRRLPPEAQGVPWAVNPGAHVVVVDADGFAVVERRVDVGEGRRQRVDVVLAPLAARPATNDATTTAADAGAGDAGRDARAGDAGDDDGGKRSPVVTTPRAPSSAPSARPTSTDPPTSHDAREPRDRSRSPSNVSALVTPGFAAGGLMLAIGTAFGVATIVKVKSIREDCEGSSCLSTRKSDADTAGTFATLSNLTLALGAVGVGVGLYGYLSGPTSAAQRPTGAVVGVGLVTGPGSVRVVGAF